MSQDSSNLIKLGSSSQNYGLCLVNFNNDLYYKSSNGLEILQSEKLIPVQLGDQYITGPGNNMAVFKNIDDKKWLVIPGTDSTSGTNILIFYTSSTIEYITLPSGASIPEWSYLQQHDGTLFLTLEVNKTFQLYGYSGTTFTAVDVPTGYTIASNLTSIPIFYPMFNMVDFHVGIHMIFNLDDSNQYKAFSYKDEGSGYQFYEWVGLECKSLMPGMPMVNFSSRNTIISYLNDLSNLESGMFKHIKGGVQEIPIPHGTEIAPGFGSIEWNSSMVVPLSDGNSTAFYTYSPSSGFAEILLLPGYNILRFGGLATVKSYLYLLISDGPSVYLYRTKN